MHGKNLVEHRYVEMKIPNFIKDRTWKATLWLET